MDYVPGAEFLSENAEEAERLIRESGDTDDDDNFLLDTDNEQETVDEWMDLDDGGERNANGEIP